ncbi:MAG: peptidoglycan-binding domain-containing protein [Pseudomonadota bacterium]
MALFAGVVVNTMLLQETPVGAQRTVTQLRGLPTDALPPARPGHARPGHARPGSARAANVQRQANPPGTPLRLTHLQTNALRPVQPRTDAGPAARSAAGPANRSRPQAVLERAIPEAELVRAIQMELAQRGYEPGEPDGVAGLVTRAAIMAYENDQRLPVRGEADERLLSLILMEGGAQRQRRIENARPRTQTRARQGTPHTLRVAQTVQRSLAALGFYAGDADGIIGPATRRAIISFETAQGMRPSGRISGRLVRRLARASVRTVER